MNYIRLKKMPLIEEIMQQYPISRAGSAKIMQDRQEIRNILAGKDKRLLLIIGPCSAWPCEAVLEYARRLSAINTLVASVLKIVMRVYIQKPRTIKGWSGPINQPDPFAPPDLIAGLHYARKMMVQVVEMGLPIADECLFTHNARGFSELVAWFAIGARSSEDHEHRIFASAANCPVGMKNPTHGSLAVSVNSVAAAQLAHVAAIDGFEVQTLGNPYAHLVLRGCNQEPNYAPKFVAEVQEQMLAKNVQNPAVLIDTSHDNCVINGNKEPRIQPSIIFEVMHYLKQHPNLSKLVKGFMVESYLKEGQQKLANCDASTIDLDGLSITDPCLGWDDTKHMLLELASILR